MSLPAPHSRPLALITGGTRRVGHAIAFALAKAGCDIVLTSRHDSDEAQRTLQDLRVLGVHAHLAILNLEDLHAFPAAAHRLAESQPRWDILVHNASTYAPAPLAETTPDRLLRDFAVHAAAPLLLSAALAPFLARSPLPGGGAIVAMADMHVLGRPRKDFASYAMSKAALVEMVRSLARDLAPNVRVNAVAPGVIAWPDSGHESDKPSQDAYLARVPLARSGTPHDAAEVVRWLALDAHYITGEVLRLDGGRWLA
jgi:pteridine reductase